MASPFRSSLLSFTLLGLAACTPAAPVTAPPSSAAPSVAPASAMPSPGTTPAAPSASPAATPTAPIASASAIAPSPQATATSAEFDLTRGRMLRRYTFKGIGGLFYDLAQDQLHVIDAVNDDVTPRRYLVRRFSRDGTFDSAVRLNKEDEDAPDAVDGYAFDDAGVPIYTYREDETFIVRRLYTATVTDATTFPSNRLERAGVAAMAATGGIVTMGVMRLDPEEKDAKTTKVREILYVRTDLNGDSEALFRFVDPFEPTVRMAASLEGQLYLFGPRPDGVLGVKRVNKDETKVDLPIPLKAIPEHVWLDPQGNLLLADQTTGKEAVTIRRFSPTGELLSQTPVTLADGQKLYDLDGLTFDVKGHPIVAGTAIDADLKETAGLFVFD